MEPRWAARCAVALSVLVGTASTALSGETPAKGGTDTKKGEEPKEKDTGKLTPSPDYALTITWKAEAPGAVKLADSPDIVYRKTRDFELKEARVCIRLAFRDHLGNPVEGTVWYANAASLPDKAGALRREAKSDWRHALDFSLRKSLMAKGKGKIQVALFECQGSPKLKTAKGLFNDESGKVELAFIMGDEAESQRSVQLSNWLELAVSVDGRE